MTQTILEAFSTMGYKNQICVDISTVVVQNMSLRLENVGGVTWRHANVLCIDKIPSSSIDVAFDKGTLDAMIHISPWDPPNEVLDNTSRYFREASRNVSHNGRLLRKRNHACYLGLSCPQIGRDIHLRVTYRQPYFIKPLLNCEGVHQEIEVDILGGSESSFDYSGFILRKVISLAAKSAEVEREQ